MCIKMNFKREVQSGLDFTESDGKVDLSKSKFHKIEIFNHVKVWENFTVIVILVHKIGSTQNRDP